jgi:hypothetical protein
MLTSLYVSKKSLRFWIRVLAVLAVGAVLCTIPGCGGLGHCEGGLPSPSLSSIAPSTINSTLLPATITVKGDGFQRSSKVWVNGVVVGSAYVSSNQLTATIAGDTIYSAGIFPGARVPVHVSTPPQSMANSIASGITGCPDGGDSGTVMLTVN